MTTEEKIKLYAFGKLNDEIAKAEVESLVQKSSTYRNILEGYKVLLEETPNKKELQDKLDKSRQRMKERLFPKLGLSISKVKTNWKEQLKQWFEPLVNPRFQFQHAAIDDFTIVYPEMNQNFETQIDIKLAEPCEDELELCLYDNQDERIYKGEIPANVDKHSLHIEDEEFHPGIYLLELTNHEYGDSTKRIINIKKSALEEA